MSILAMKSASPTSTAVWQAQAPGSRVHKISDFGIIPIWDLRWKLGKSWGFRYLKSVFTKEYENLLSLLVKSRKESRLTQQDIADKLGRPQSFVSKYERGERRLDVIEFLVITRIIGLSASDIVADLERQLPD